MERLTTANLLELAKVALDAANEADLLARGRAPGVPYRDSLRLTANYLCKLFDRPWSDDDPVFWNAVYDAVYYGEEVARREASSLQTWAGELIGQLHNAGAGFLPTSGYQGVRRRCCCLVKAAADCMFSLKP